MRLLPMSEVMIQEVRVITTGFAQEFGRARQLPLILDAVRDGDEPLGVVRTWTADGREEPGCLGFGLS